MKVMLKLPPSLIITAGFFPPEANTIFDDDMSWSYEELQTAIDTYTLGSWSGDEWNSTSPFQGLHHVNDILEVFQNVSEGQNFTIGFMGDSTTRSDLRAWEEEFKCTRTELDERNAFQKLKDDGMYVCHVSEKSVNLTKCGIPPIVNVSNCPDDSGLSFRYFYKIYPWTPLDQWFLQQTDLFQDIDVLVISMGRWLVYWNGQMNVTGDMEHFLVELQRVYTGKVLYQSEYAQHTISLDASKPPVNCEHDPMVTDSDKYVCTSSIDWERPQRDLDLRSVMERFQVPYLDRWNISKTLPIEHYESWLCGNQFSSWFCDHHLGFVAMEHMRLIAHVLKVLYR